MTVLTAVALLVAACDRGGTGAPLNPDDLPAATFGFEVAGFLDPPDAEGFWEPADIEVAEGPEKDIWIVDRKAGHVYRYDQQGSYRGRISRPGSGPGELSGALALGIARDTLWVYNAGSRRIDYFGMDGEALATQPLPEEGSLVDVISVGEDFVASSVFGRSPLIRFPRAPGAGGTGPATGFGQELAAAELELAGEATPEASGRVPSVYRVALVDGRIWALHLYLPLIGIFASDGRLIRLVTYPAEPVEPGGERVQEVDGVRRRIQNAPAEPAGAIGLLEGLDGEVYVLTHQSDAGRQRLYALSRDGDLIGRVESPFDGWMAVSTGDGGGRRYVLVLRGETEEPAVLRLKAPSGS